MGSIQCGTGDKYCIWDSSPCKCLTVSWTCTPRRVLRTEEHFCAHTAQLQNLPEQRAGCFVAMLNLGKTALGRPRRRFTAPGLHSNNEHPTSSCIVNRVGKTEAGPAGSSAGKSGSVIELPQGITAEWWHNNLLISPIPASI